MGSLWQRGGHDKSVPTGVYTHQPVTCPVGGGHDKSVPTGLYTRGHDKSVPTGHTYTLVTTEHMAATLTTGPAQQHNHAIALTRPLVLPEADLSITPYFFGTWLLQYPQSGAGNKHIPIPYLRASEQKRRDLLAGLLDPDGTVNH